MDPKDDGIGAKKEAKDARASTRITCLYRLYAVREEVVEGYTEWKNESGLLGEPDKC